MVRAAYVGVAMSVVVAALLGVAACEGDRLGFAATNECAPLDDPAVHITSEGITEDGHYVVIMGEGAGARVFYGIAAHMVEGTISSTKPGCALEVGFEVQGRAYLATFSPDAARCMVESSLVSGAPDGPQAKTPLAAIEVAGQPADAGDAAATGAPLTFYCL